MPDTMITKLNMARFDSAIQGETAKRDYHSYLIVSDGVMPATNLDGNTKTI